MIAEMFNRIAPTYDLLNRLLSGRQDVKWRHHAVKQIPQNKFVRVLDIAVGTGDLSIAMLKSCRNISEIVGVDVAENMLDIARQKMAKDIESGRVKLQIGDACILPFENEKFDIVTISFGIRNVADPLLALSEIYRVLKSEGRVIILEFSTPDKWLKPFYYLYFRHLLPFIGGLISGDREAYRYLNRSAEAFASGEKFLSWMKRAGFSSVRAKPLSFGIASIYVGDKGESA